MGVFAGVIKIVLIALEAMGIGIGLYELNTGIGRPVAVPAISLLDGLSMGAGTVPAGVITVLVCLAALIVTSRWSVKWSDGAKVFALGAPAKPSND